MQGAVETAHLNFREWPKKYGKTSKYFLGRQAYVLCSDPELLQQAATKQSMTFHDRYRKVHLILASTDPLHSFTALLSAFRYLDYLPAGCTYLSLLQSSVKILTANLEDHVPDKHSSDQDLLFKLPICLCTVPELR